MTMHHNPAGYVQQSIHRLKHRVLPSSLSIALVLSVIAFSGVGTISLAEAHNGTAPTCNSLTATIWVNHHGVIVGGTQSGATFGGSLTGTSGNDVIILDDSGGIVDGGDGNDTICGGSGQDILNGEGGNDWMDGGGANDILNGDDGDDALFGGSGTDICNGDAGANTFNSCETKNGTEASSSSSSVTSSSSTSSSSSVSSSSSSSAPSTSSSSSTVSSTSSTSSTSSLSSSSSFSVPTCKGLTATIYVQGGMVVGGPDNGDAYTGDLTGTSGNDVIVGTSGVDDIDSGIGNDTVCGNGGNDVMDGGIGNDLLCGDDGNDDIDGGIGVDTLCGGDGNDILEGGIDDDALDGGSGTDTLEGELGSDQCVNGESLSGCETTSGTVPACASSSSSSSSLSSSTGSSVSSSSSSSSVVQCLLTDLAGYWKFDENTATGAIALDSSGNGRHGTLVNGPVYVSGTPVISPNASALDFDGSNDQVTVSGSAFDFANSNFTVSTHLRTTTGDRSVLGHFDNPGSGFRGWGLYVYASNRVNFFGYGDAGTNDVSHAAATILNGNWHHVAGVYSRSGSLLTIKAYVDGVLVGTNTGSVGTMTAATNLLFGKYLFQPNFDGTLDDVRVYSRALTASEISQLALNCAGGSSSSSSSSSSSLPSSSSALSGSSASSSASVTTTASSDGGSQQQSGLTIPSPGGHGSYRGNRTNTMAGVASFLIGVLSGGDGIAPGAFGGVSALRLTKAQEDIICSIQRSWPDTVSQSLTQWMAVYLSPRLHRDVDVILHALQDDDLCEPQAEATTETALASIPLVVNAAGFPVSSNATWNACIAGTATLQDIRNNTDMNEDGIGHSCADYHTGDVWYHPDLGIHFTFEDDTHEIILPPEYVIEHVNAVSLQ